MMRQFSCGLGAKCILAVLALLFGAVAACTRAASSSAPAAWNRYVAGSIVNAKIYNGVVLFGVVYPGSGSTRTDAFDVQSGKRLWERTGALPLSGASSFLAVGGSVDRVDARSGRVVWHSAPLCAEPGTAPSDGPTYATTIGDAVYIGCGGGKIQALRLSSGDVFASAHPTRVDSYDQIAALGRNELGVSGEASGAYLSRESAIVKRDTLSTVVALGPGRRILRARGKDVLVEDTCCQGVHSDSWPADIQRVALSSGETVSVVSLHPYARPLAQDSDLPGPGITLAVGDTLYVATHSALFAYDLKNLRGQPRTLFSNLANLPSLIQGRYFSIQEGAPRNVRRVAILDAYDAMRVIWSDSGGGFEPHDPHATTRQQLVFYEGHAHAVAVDASCMLGASSKSYLFMVCTNVNMASRAHLGGTPKSFSSAEEQMLPESIAVYALAERR